MATTDAAVRRGRGRRPAGEVRAGVLAAAARLLFEDGISAVTFERVATAAGSSKMTLYKWWPSTGALAAEAFFARSEHAPEFPDTGDIQADLRTQLRAFVALLSADGVGHAIAGLIGAAQTDHALAQAWSTGYSLPRRQLAVDALERARQRGQLREGMDLGILVDQLWGACYNRLLVPDAPLNLAYADALVANALQGASVSGRSPHHLDHTGSPETSSGPVAPG